jgi:two-component system phosphate regulon response regulator PhoB
LSGRTKAYPSATRAFDPAPPAPVETPSTTTPEPEDPTIRQARQAPDAPPTVLVVDDDPDLREVVGAMLEAVGLVVESVESAEQALERIPSLVPNLILLDWSLPGISGIEMCRRLRRDPVHASLPVLFLTAHSGTQEMVEAFAAGADDYVVKPFRAAELGARIFGLLRRARVSSARDAS